MKKKFFFRLFFLLAGLAGFWFLQRLFVPKYGGKVIEGNFIAEYYEETLPSDLLILGDCEVYENISPIVLWQEYGITSYIRGSAQQLIPQSYYLLEDTLRYETPKVVLLSISAMQEEKQVNEAYNRMTMEGMRWSGEKYQAIQATMMEEEHLIDYVIPLFRYHSRWKELSYDDIRYFWSRPKVSHNGYYMRADVQAAEEFPSERRRANYQFSEFSYSYLDKLRVLCEEQGIQLILYKAPSLYPVWHEQWDRQILDYADTYGLTYINCISLIEEIGLDFSKDTYNGGQHLNVYGAEKLSFYLGNYLNDATNLDDYRGSGEYHEIWQEKVVFYDEMKTEQEYQWNTFGYISRFTDEEEK